MVKKNYGLSLLEVALAMALCTIVLSILFSSFTQSQKLELQAIASQEKTLGPELVRIRLTRLFDKISPLEGDKNPLFFTKSLPKAQREALHFAASGILDTYFDFCHTVEHNLYLSYEGNLCLTTSFKQKRKTDVLLTQLSTWDLEFFNPKTLSWEKTWSKKEVLPSMIKMKWTTKKKDEESCVFFLNPNPPVTYKI